MDVKYPDITVQLTGQDGNAFMVLALVEKAMRKAGLSKEEIDEYRKEAMAGDYDNLLVVSMQTVNVE